MNINDIGTVFGDRVVVRRLTGPQTVRGFYVPDSYRNQKRDRQAIWWGEVVKFGLDSRASEAYNLRVGDIIGLDPVAQDCSTLKMDDGEFVWVPEEFISAKDDGTIRALFGEGKEKEHAIA